MAKIASTWIGKHLKTPQTPDAGESALYFNASGQLCKKGNNGLEVVVEGGSAATTSLIRAAEGATTLPANGWAAIGGLTTTYSRGSMFSHSGGVITSASAGWAEFTAQCYFNTGGATRYILRIISGTNPDANILAAGESTGYGGGVPSLNISTGPIQVAAGTQIRAYVYCTSTVGTDVKFLSAKQL